MFYGSMLEYPYVTCAAITSQVRKIINIESRHLMILYEAVMEETMEVSDAAPYHRLVLRDSALQYRLEHMPSCILERRCRF